MSALRGRTAALLALVVALLAVVAPPAGAKGATPASRSALSVTMSDVRSSESSVTGVLTFRSADVVQVDTDSLRAEIDGQERPAAASSSTSSERTSMLVIDTSGSMGPDGMATVREATRTYLAEVPDDVRVGVATFANTAGVDLAPTADRAKVQRVVDGLVARGDTSLYAGVSAAAKALGTQGDRSMVLLSDGADTISTARAAHRATATREVRTRGIRVDVVRFKTDDPDATSALRGFASAGGGSVISAADTASVGAAFRTSARALRSQARFEVTTPSRLTGRHTVRLEGTAGGTPFAVERTVDLGGAGVAPAPAPTRGVADSAIAPVGGLSLTATPWPWLGALALGLSLFLLAHAMLTPTLTPRERRLAAIDTYVAPGMQRRADVHGQQATPLTQRMVELGERRMARRSSTAGTMLLIQRADLPLRAGEWYVLTVLAIVVGVVLGLVVVPGPALLGIVVGLALGLFLPRQVLRFLAARRAKAFERVLPQALVLVATTLRSGFGLPQALAAVAQDAAAPVDKEFSRALAETRIGTDIADALEHMADRMGSDSMHMAVLAIRIQREVGGNLAETLETTAHTLRERQMLLQQIATLSAEGRLSAQILIALPIGVFFYMTLVNYDYISLLWTTVPGVVMSFGAVVLIVIGIFWMRRVVRIEV